MDSLDVRGEKYKLPIFLPDATRGVAKGIDAADLRASGIEGVVVNTYHLLTDPGTDVLEVFGGVKEFMNFRGLVVSDSGGWQVYSLIHRNDGGGSVEDRGVVFKVGKRKKDIFTPERSIRTQFSINSDVMICLDDFTPPDATKEQAKETVRRTIYWAKNSKREFERQVKKHKFSEKNRPHLYAVVQGGYFKDLRKKCAEELIELGFDGYGYGGYVVDDDGNLDLDLSSYICDLLPDDKPKFALGIGKPMDIVNLAKMGWDIFDCTLPTRDARHMRLYKLEDNIEKLNDLNSKDQLSYIYIAKEVYKKDQEPISRHCQCHTCQNYSRSYLRHLFKIKDTLAYRLATIHNLFVYSRIIDLLRKN